VLEQRVVQIDIDSGAAKVYDIESSPGSSELRRKHKRERFLLRAI
jgi:hypothetical protein